MAKKIEAAPSIIVECPLSNPLSPQEHVARKVEATLHGVQRTNLKRAFKYMVDNGVTFRNSAGRKQYVTKLSHVVNVLLDQDPE